MDTTAVGGNGIFALSAGATLISAHPNGVNGNLQTTGQITLSKVANFTFNGTVAQVAGTLLPDSVNVLTISNPAGVSFTDTLRSAKLIVPNGAVMKIDASGSVTADSGSVAGTVVNKGVLTAVAPLVFENGSIYEHARDGGSVPTATWEKGSTALFTGITATAPDNRGQDYYNLTLNTPGLASNRDLNLQGRTIGGNLTVINTGSARWQMVGGVSGTVKIMGDVIVQAGQFATQGTSSTTNVVVEHHGNINVTGGNFSISRGTQGSGAGTTIWNLREGNFSMSNATTQNSNPTPGKAKFVFAKRGGLQNLTLVNVTYMGGGLPIQVDTLVTLNMDTTAVGGNGIFALSAGATLISAHPNGVNGNLQTTGQITLSKAANFTFNGTVAQVAGTLLPDSVNVLTISNPAGVSFTDTLRSAKLIVPNGAVMKIDASGSVTADSGLVAGTVVNKGVLTAVAPLVFENGSIYEHARDGGSIPSGVWQEGSTLLMTGTTSTAPSNSNQSYHNITFNTPGLSANLNMGLNNNTIGGDVRVINTGSNRWYLTSALADSTAIVKIRGDVIVEGGQFSVQGTSNARTIFIVHHYGDVVVTGGNFSVARGSQGNGSGSTRWYLHQGNFSMSNATTQNSNPTNAWFVFDKDGVQNLALSSVTYGGGGLAIEVADSTTLDFGSSELGGSGRFALNKGATLATAHANGIAGAVQSTGNVTFDNGANYMFNGTTAQITSTLMPTTVNDLIINNKAGVKLSQITTINGVLRLMAGEFDNTIPFTLGPGGSISYEGGSLKFPVSVVERLPEIPAEFALLPNYPNPFNPSTTIRYQIPKRTTVTLKIYDATGREVAALMNGKPHEPGTYDLFWDARGLASGVYYYRISADEFTSVRKLTLVK
ncbi:MAG: T9SS type A sorting domain-containing protein [candidate division KSB1 bacterium]|nr:T9SS type A sorting domain-containing protein [candidate division KSB1 bacterium]MDZ7304812.1 T9SS type A sorting domain-containing protein [candidate division KSB1 bacterium]MDZ7312951.1 T9SS type A sorting domain-containing protein [candidate division KSB1 bacterium]